MIVTVQFSKEETDNNEIFEYLYSHVKNEHNGIKVKHNEKFNFILKNITIPFFAIENRPTKTPLKFVLDASEYRIEEI